MTTWRYIVDRGASGMIRGKYTPRYSVFEQEAEQAPGSAGFQPSQPPSCVAMGDDVEALRTKYNVELPVVDHSRRGLRKR